MTQALKTQEATRKADLLTPRERRDLGSQKTLRPIDSFLSELRRMTPEERIRASRYTMTLRERYVYAARYPDEVPTVNGELEWIALYAE